MKMYIKHKLLNISKHIGEPIEADEAPSENILVANESPKSTSQHWSHGLEVEVDLPKPKSPKIESAKSTDPQPSSSKSKEENESEKLQIFRALNLSKNTMAVKKHELVPENCNQLDLAALAQYIKVLLNEQHNYLPPPNDLIKNCQDIVKCLSRSSGKEELLWEHLQVIEEFLLRMVHTVHTSTRNEIIKTVLEHLYTLVSDPQSDACPATSVVLIVFDGLHDEEVLSSARWLVQKDQNGPAGAGLRASLSCLYRWTHEWNGTPLLGNWVSAYIKALEEIERYDILMEVSLENLTDLFITLEAPTASRQSSADVVFHILASLRESVDALDRIASHVGRILMNLAADSGAWSRQMLQNVVDIISAMIDYHTEKLKSDAQVQFREKYLHVILELERYMVSRDCRYIQLPAWHGGEVCLPTSTSDHPPLRKVGLINLGNTCYMNSVMQALLFTRRFSNHVVLRMLNTPYWSPMGLMFAKMMHSVSTKLNPDEFFALVKPPFFHNGNQHDSSEFLGYLLELLSSYEHVKDINYDYARPTELQRGVYYQRALTYGSAHASPTYSYASDYDSDASRRSVSPRPGSSAAAGGAAAAGGGGGAGAGSSNGLKRSSPERADSMMPLKKRRLNVDTRERESPSLRRQSVVDSMFGGVLLTRVQCSTCSTSSISRDVFRDLQLAFPEKPDGWQYTVQALLEYYCSLEIMTGENRYFCPSCGCLQEAEKNVIIESTPKILVLVLKNFKFDQKLQMQKKALHSMYHNMTVTLPTVRSQTNATYYMYAAVVHAGTSLDSGHYYTLALDGGQWYMYNDDTVTTAHEAQLNKLERGNTPYILFYRRKDVEEGAAPCMEELPPQVQQAVLAHNKHCVDAVRNKRLNCP